jgi:hypothetical protein
MTDIVERLRQKERDYYRRDTGGAYGMGPVLRDAADEIERLRGLLERAAESIGRFCSDEGWTEADMDTLDACIAALPVTPDQPSPCQHDPSKPSPTLRPGYPENGVMIHFCNVCQGRFPLPITTASAADQPPVGPRCPICGGKDVSPLSFDIWECGKCGDYVPDRPTVKS